MATRTLRLADPYAELPIRNQKYVKNCTELYLANKRIEKIAHFDAFTNLEVLWINGNQIQELEGLDSCFRLKQLYAQTNFIRSLKDSSLPHFKFLQELRLYDNKLKDLQETLDVISRLSRLRDLDLFGNAVVEEENYRLQVIRAIPSLHVLDRHVITNEERAKASRLRLNAKEDRGVNRGATKSTKPAASTDDTPLPEMSGTVKLLFKEVAAIKREQEKQAHERAEREQEELKQSRKQALKTTSRSTTSSPNTIYNIPGLNDYETTALKHHFQSLEEAKNSGIIPKQLTQICQYLRTRGYVIMHNGLRLEGDEDATISMAVPGKISWELFVKLFESKQLQCDLLSPQELQQQAALCFDTCAVMQRRLQALNIDDVKSTQLVKESFQLSQQGYHLQALVEDKLLSNRCRSTQVPSSVDGKDDWKPVQTSTPRTRFYMTTYHREKTLRFSELNVESEHIPEALAGKYKIRHKDFTKYLTKQSLQSTKLVRRNYQL